MSRWTKGYGSGHSDPDLYNTKHSPSRSDPTGAYNRKRKRSTNNKCSAGIHQEHHQNTYRIEIDRHRGGA